MEVRDVDGVYAIECLVFPAPWSWASFKDEITDNASARSWVVEADDAVVAYLVSWHVVDELHIGNIAVAPERRSKGIGAALLEHALEDAVENGVALATLEVRMSNAPAIALYHKFGFREVAIRKGYYSDDGEDALVMLKNLGDEAQEGSLEGARENPAEGERT